MSFEIKGVGVLNRVIKTMSALSFFEGLLQKCEFSHFLNLQLWEPVTKCWTSGEYGKDVYYLSSSG
jgi:hypothetical protein